MNDKIQKLNKQIDQLKNRLSQEKAKLKFQEMKNDSRRKFLHGVAVLAAVEAGEFDQQQITTMLDKYITTERDRVFLGLPKK